MKRSITRENAEQAIASIMDARAALAKVVVKLELLAALPIDEQTQVIANLIDDHYAARTMVGELHLGALGVVTECSDIESLAIREAEQMLDSDVETVPSVAYSKATVVVRELYANGVCGMCDGKAEVCMSRHAKGRDCA